MNQLIGGVFALIGMYKCIPLVHGSQGCANYVKHIIVEHFKEPIDIATTGFHEYSAIQGEGIENIIKAIENIEVSKNPELIGICTTGLSETIGENIKSDIKNNYNNKNIVAINTPSYSGSHIDGYNNAMYSIISGILEKDNEIEIKKEKNNKINLIHGVVNPGDVRELQHIFDNLGIQYNLLNDIKSMDRPLRLPKEEYPKCDTTIDNIKNSIYSKATVSFGMEGVDGASYLEKYGVISCNLKYPIGIKNTDKFILNLLNTAGENDISDISNIPEPLLDDRGYALDAMANTNAKLKNKKVAIYGAPDQVIGLVDLANEIGLKVVAVLSNTKTNYFAETIQKLNRNIEVISGDLYDFGKSLKDKNIDFIIGDYRSKYIANSLNVPSLKVGFPVIDVYGHPKKTMLGYNGALNLINEMANL
ncbi:nitrogenase component 1 [Methanococcus aeolicus]|uniref:nitrogenase component 1 n=1 Tax=Methanococcus aeolicus TaxID=42879 RepID=UPI0021CA82D5|nr:nitrogenase component 1 [Methanococcus aeolicus]UXM84999.1 nitrogenase [Methanococcus aeolicus]